MENKLYSDQVMDHFYHPRNVGEIPNPDGVGKEGGAKCGDELVIYIKVNDGIITEAKFRTFGCATAIAASSMITEMVIGKSIDEAYKVTSEQIVTELGGVPQVKKHCSVLGAKALRKAIDDYRLRK